jgi:hypothetical protein
MILLKWSQQVRLSPTPLRMRLGSYVVWRYWEEVWREGQDKVGLKWMEGSHDRNKRA